jgi:carbamate kinase
MTLGLLINKKMEEYLMALAKIVVALGGNALQRKGAPATAEAQLEVVTETVQYIAEMSCRDYELAVVHGNGPQVGNIVLASETAADVVPVMPFDVCGAMSQGYIGYHIQQALRFALQKRNRNIPVATLVTQVVVDKDDPAFQNPTKPIGAFYAEDEAKRVAAEKGYSVKEDSGRGWRRVVASPMPKRIVEFSCLTELWDTTIVITAGGGGIPVIEKEDGSLEGIAAVIDKDLAAARLAEDIGADILMILTEVEKVSLNFNKPDQKDLDHITVAEAEKYIAEGHFAPGSMLPKVQAAVNFVKGNPGKKAMITSLFKSLDALDGKTGTVIS